MVYFGRLFYLQIAGRQSTYDDGQVTRTVTVQAARGEIYDRNGIKLVGNRYTYHIVLSYGSFSALSAAQKNEVILQLADARRACADGGVYPGMYDPFRGSYPSLSYTSAALDSETPNGYRLHQVSKAHRWEEIPRAEELVKYYVDTYEMQVSDEEGNRRYTDREIDTLISFYYDMDAKVFSGNGEYLFVSEIDLEESASVQLMTYVKEKSLPAVRFNGTVERVYLYPGVASHILGSVGPIYAEEWKYYNSQGYQMNAIVGKDGCEYAFEAYLHGKDGEIEITEDANGNILNVKMLREPIPGSDIHLTIDINLQIAAEEGLKKNVLETAQTNDGSQCDSGAAVAIDPDTFEVLAIASYPTYNLATFNEDYAALKADPAEPLRNRVLNEAYAPGSTLKLGMAVMGLMEGKISADEVVSCNGFYQGAVGCSTYRQNHWGGLDLAGAISCSCNSYFCEIGNRVGINTMETYLSRWGLGKTTGIELGGAIGILAGPTYRAEIQSSEPWSLGMTWHASIGQSDHKMSPLQMATYTATLVGGGTRYAATLLHSVHPNSTKVEAPTLCRQVLDQFPIPDTVRETLHDAMVQMVKETDYVRKQFASLPADVTVGGKTGTAQVPGTADNALFVCEASTAAGTDVVISVILEAGAHGYYASSTAGAILEEYYR